MIVKIERQNKRRKNREGNKPSNIGFMLFDGVDQVNVSESGREFNTRDEFHDWCKRRNPLNLCDYEPHWDYDKAPLCITELILWKIPKNHQDPRTAEMVVFDSHAYICNNNGKTIESIYVHQDPEAMSHAESSL